jgi:hypothetical protein
MTEVQTSPDSHLNYSTQIADFVRKNVEKADPNKGRCLITNDPSTTQLCHCISGGDNKLVRLYRVSVFGSEYCYSSIASNMPGT